MQKVSLLNYRGNNINSNNSASNMSRVSFSGLPKCELPSLMEHIAGQIRNVTLKIAFGDMTKIKADAYIVPQFNSFASYGGVGGAVARAGGTKGIDEFAKFVAQKGEQNFGTVLLTKAYGGNSDKLLHTVSVDSSNEFDTVQASIYNALRIAEENGVKSVASPALGSGLLGQLTPEQSAKATLSAIKQFADEERNMDVSVVIYRDKGAYNDFVNAFSTKSYENATNEAGKKNFDLSKYLKSIQINANANKFYKDMH